MVCHTPTTHCRTKTSPQKGENHILHPLYRIGTPQQNIFVESAYICATVYTRYMVLVDICMNIFTSFFPPSKNA